MIAFFKKLVAFFKKLLDERFFAHRQRSTSIAGVAVVILSLIVFEYRLIFKHVWSWDLLAVGLGFVVIKLSLMTYFYLTD